MSENIPTGKKLKQYKISTAATTIFILVSLLYLCFVYLVSHFEVLKMFISAGGAAGTPFDRYVAEITPPLVGLLSTFIVIVALPFLKSKRFRIITSVIYLIALAIVSMTISTPSPVFVFIFTAIQATNTLWYAAYLKK